MSATGVTCAMKTRITLLAVTLLVFSHTQTANAYEVVNVDGGGSITGKVLLKGKPLLAKRFKVEKTPEVCGQEDRLLYEMRVKDGALADVVLYLEGVTAGKPFAKDVVIEGPPPGARKHDHDGGMEFPGTTIRPKNCIFGAFTGVVANGKLMRFRNQDPVKHSPHTYAVKGRVRKSMFNMDLEGNGSLDVPIDLKKKIKVVKLECDQHNHMQNWFYRVDSPYYAFSGDDGDFTIDKVPPGEYQLVAWHPKIKKILKQKLTVEPNGVVDVVFEFKSRRK